MRHRIQQMPYALVTWTLLFLFVENLSTSMKPKINVLIKMISDDRIVCECIAHAFELNLKYCKHLIQLT